MPVVKKTLAIHPIIDQYVRDMWAILIQAGYDASYSTALNYMLLEHIRSVSEHGIEKNVSNDLNSFLEDEETIEELNLEEYANKADDFLSKRSKRKESR
ncbi:MAG: hypothetical protein ACYDAJ_07235 [Nitrosotalea sp.]